MRARIYNEDKNKYYISEIYGILNCGADIYIVDKMDDSNAVILVDYLDFSSDLPYNVNIEIIDINPLDQYKWVYMQNHEMEFINDAMNSPNKYHYFRGYEFISKEKNALVELIKRGTVNKNKLNIKSISTKLSHWNYIENHEDIEYLMKQFYGFHDSIIKELSYFTGDYISQDGSMHLSRSGEKQIKLVFESQFGGKIELVMLAPKFVQLIPPAENYLANLDGASVFLKDCMVYFYDSYFPSIPEIYDGTYIIAMGMIWRFMK